MKVLNYAELIYYITGGPVLAVVAIIGLWQIYIAKRSLQVNSRRDAYRLSSHQTKYYLTEIIPVLTEVEDKLTELEMNDLEKSIRVEVKGKRNADHLLPLLT